MIQSISSKFEQAYRLLYIQSISLFNKSLIVVEYPKSGGTWLGQIISEYLDIPFPRNKFPSLNRSLIHGHYKPSKLIKKNWPIILIIRDGRDIVVSLYHQLLIENDKTKKNPKEIKYYRNKLNYSNYNSIHENLSSFIEFIFTHRPSKLHHFTHMGDWTTYNKRWLSERYNCGLIVIKYEDMLSNTFQAISKILSSIDEEINEDKLKSIIDHYSFENQAKRKPGIEDKSSFLRKGVSGDWRNYFGANEKALFKKYGGDLLIELGYEENMKW